MIISELSVGTPLHWVETDPRTGERRDRYAVAVRGAVDAMDCVEVFPLYPWNRCFDEGGADYGEHHDNVRLKHAPPPFLDLALEPGARGVYTYADLEHPIRVDDAFLSRFQPDMPDGGFPVHPDDIADILDHFWHGELSFGKDGFVFDDRDEELDSLVGSIDDSAEAAFSGDWKSFAQAQSPAPEASQSEAVARMLSAMPSDPDAGSGFGPEL